MKIIMHKRRYILHIIIFVIMIFSLVSNSFAGQQKILVIYEGEYTFSELIDFLIANGYQAELFHLDELQITDELLCGYTQFWFFGSNAFNHRNLSNAEVDSVIAFHNNGGGLLLVTDHQHRPDQYCRYQNGGDYTVNFDRFAKVFGVECIGCIWNPDHLGPGGWSLFSPDIAQHEIWDGVTQITAHDSECEMKIDSPLVQIIGSMTNDYPILAVKESEGYPQGRVVFDSTFGRYTDGLLYSGSNPQYVLNIAQWLGGEPTCNLPPTANAGPDQTVSCSGVDGATVMLDGSLSSDPDGDTLTYTWAGPFGTASGVNPTVTIPLGTHTITLTVDDGKDGTAQDTVVITVVDNVPPLTTAIITGTTGNNGWYISDVLVDLISTDNCSGGKEIHYILNSIETIIPDTTASIMLNMDGVHNLSYSAVDNVGNVEPVKTTEIKIDATPPEITIRDVTGGEVYFLCNAPTPDYEVTDATSGVDTSNATLSGGNVNGVGTFTYEVTATDIAGNTSTKAVPYKVTYSFTDGFQPPVTLGKPFKHGSTIPVKFELTDGCGNNVQTATATLTLQFYSGEKPVGDPIDATSNVPDSGNLFRFTEGHYIYNLATNNLQIGNWLATVALDDGTSHTIFIGIK